MMKSINPSRSIGGILWIKGALSFPLLGLKVWLYLPLQLGQVGGAGGLSQGSGVRPVVVRPRSLCQARWP